MLFSYAFVIGALFSVCSGTVTVTPQPPYQGVYLYQEVGASLLGITSCENIPDVSNVTLRDTKEFTSTNCSYQGKDVKLSFLKEKVAEPVLNSTNARYYLLPRNTSLTGSPPGWYRSDVEVHCWNGENWVTDKGWITEDKKNICCNNRNDLCSDIIFLDESDVLKEQQNELEVGYGFQINYTTTLWPYDKLRTKLTCGKFFCLFDGTQTESGSCTDLHYDLTTEERYNSATSAPSLSSGHRLLHDLRISVPYLTKAFKGADKCEMTLFLGEVEQELVRSVLQLNLTNTPPIVSVYSDVGLYNLADFEDTDEGPKCIGDGWPPPETMWMFKDQEKRKFGPKKKLASKVYQCKVKSEDSFEIKHMMFIKVGDRSYFYSSASRILDEGKNLTLACKIDFRQWDPEPNRFGWTHSNGTEFPIPHDPSLGKDTDHWEVPVMEEGIYKCWAEIDNPWSEEVPRQNASFRVSKDITIELRRSSSPGTQTITDITSEPDNITAHPSSIHSTKDGKEDMTEAKDPSSHWYLIGLGILALFLAIFTTFIYKIVKKNQAKVSTLDTKLSLDKVRTKMGVNALYSKVNLEDEEPLLARIPRIGKEDLVTDRVLGSGQFGKVLKGRLTITDEDGAPGEIDVAVKCLMHPDDDSSTEDFLKEVVMMYKLDHPNVIKLLGVCTEYDQYMIVSEFMAHGNLRDFLMNREPVLSLVDKLYICYQVVCGLDHMVAQDIVHRDIAARNCLVGPNLVVKVADFGLSRSLAMSNYYKKVGGQVPIRWMSPESLKYGKYTPESDVWAFGVLMWEVYTEGHFPYSGYSNEEVQEMLDNGFKLHVPPHCTEDVSVLMQATWETDPADRPTFRTIRTRLNQMLRNSGMSNILYSSASPDSLPSTSTQGSEDAALGDSTLMTDNNVRSPNCCQADTLTHAPCFAGEGSSRTTCFLGEESSSGTITNTEVAINRYASEPGVITVETAL